MMSTSTSDQREKRKCFIITPIGDSASEIRRHIDGIIDAAIIPALQSTESIEYEVIVPHRKYESTTITKQIYTDLYKSDLVIANLTGLNPNVMYELATRFCFGKPVILIAECGTPLPFDVQDQRVHFYKNDAKGTIELIDEISKALDTVNYNGEKESPIHDALSEAVLFESTEQTSSDNKIEKMLSRIMNRLDKIESSNLSDYKVRFSESPYFPSDYSIHKSLNGSYTIQPQYQWDTPIYSTSLSNMINSIKEEKSKTD